MNNARDVTRSVNDTTDSPQRQVELRSELGELMALGGRRGKNQFVIVAAGRLAMTREQRVGADRQARQLVFKKLGAHFGTLGDVAEVGEQAVGDVDRGVGQLALLQGEPQFDARRRLLQRGDAAR